MTKPIFLTFGERDFQLSKFRLSNQAILSDWFSRIICLDKIFLLEKFSDKIYYMENTRGYGYWFWKPYCILKTLQTIPKNEVLLYVDSGCSINYHGKEKFDRFLESIYDQDKIMLGFTMDMTKRWTKRDLYVYTNTDSLNFHNGPQTIGGINFWKHTDETLDFINQWFKLSLIENLIDDSESLAKNYEEFIEHRHDQSILSLLVLKKLERFISVSKIPFYSDLNGQAIKEEKEPILITGLRDFSSPINWIYKNE